MEPEKNYDLGPMSRIILKILKTLKKENKILGFGIVDIPLDLTYTVFVDERRSFYVKFRFITKFSLFCGAEVGERHGWETLILVDKNWSPKRLQSLIKGEIDDRKRGILLEAFFQKHLERLVKDDKEVNKIISGIFITNEDEDLIYKIDRFIVLSGGGKVPIQIKSSLYGSSAHKRSGSQIPSLVYDKNMPDDVFKSKVLFICNSYHRERLIEHL
jgi:hypothetical protein